MQSLVGGKQNSIEYPEDDDAMEEAEENHSGERVELRHESPEHASNDEDIVRAIKEKANIEMKILKQKIWVKQCH